jgi:hypothetical protein
MESGGRSRRDEAFRPPRGSDATAPRGRGLGRAGGSRNVSNGSVIAAGIVADAMSHDQRGFRSIGNVMRAVVGLVGILLLVGGTLRRA